MDMPCLVSIQVALPRTYGSEDALDPHDRLWTTSFFKQPVAGPVLVGETNLAGDGQADLENHNSHEKAVLAYSADNYPLWRAELSMSDMPYGGFGENLTIRGSDEQSVCIGDVWEAGEVMFEVSQPRQPCWKLARRWRITDLAKRVIANGRSGWYLRVLKTGTLAAPCDFVLRPRPHPDWTVARASDIFYHRRHDRALTAELASLPELAESWRSALHERL